MRGAHAASVLNAGGSPDSRSADFPTGHEQAVGVFTNSRGIIVPDLTPGTVYNLQARAIGGTTGYSDWSDPVSRRAM